jgi:soluble lytic murein transglycosylase-like protein
MFGERDYRDEASRYWQAKTHLSAGQVEKGRALLLPLLNRPRPSYYTLLARQALKEGEAVAAKIQIKKMAEGLPNPNELNLTLTPETWNANARLAAFTPPKPSSPVSDQIPSSPKLDSSAVKVPYADSIRQLSRLLQIDPYLVMGIVRSESAFNSKALSNAGAQGLMQLMPYTAVRLSQLVDDKKFRLEDLQTGETNLLYGTMYLTLLLDYYKGHPVPAVAAYNAGPVMVDKWLKECKGCPVDAFVEYIPYAETRNYVKKVLSAYVAFKSAETHTDPEFLSRELPKDIPEQTTIF